MSKAASLSIRLTTTLFGRFLVSLDRFLMVHAEVAARNGDLPYFGL